MSEWPAIININNNINNEQRDAADELCLEGRHGDNDNQYEWGLDDDMLGDAVEWWNRCWQRWGEDHNGNNDDDDDDGKDSKDDENADNAESD